MKQHCKCNGPYTCKAHDGQLKYCTEPSCLCHMTPQVNKCICEDDNKLTQAFCPVHGGPAYRIQEGESWEEDFDNEFISIGWPLVTANPDRLKTFIRTLLSSHRHSLIRENQLLDKKLTAHAHFVADVLDGEKPERAWRALTKELDLLSRLDK